MKQTPNQKRLARARRTHVIARKSGNPRLVVFRSNTAMYAQIVDDASGTVLCGASSLKKGCNMAAAAEVGKEIAKLAKEKGVSKISFDRNGYRYHGKIKALADGAREGGLQF